MPKILISYKDVISALSELNTKKAYGPDGIPPVVLKTCAYELEPCHGKLFRLSFYFNIPFLLEMCNHSACAEEGGPLSTLKPPSNFFILRSF